MVSAVTPWMPSRRNPEKKNNIFRKFTDTCDYDRLNMETFLSSRGLSTASIAEILGTHQTGNFLTLFAISRFDGQICGLKKETAKWRLFGFKSDKSVHFWMDLKTYREKAIVTVVSFHGRYLYEPKCWCRTVCSLVRFRDSSVQIWDRARAWTWVWNVKRHTQKSPCLIIQTLSCFLVLKYPELLSRFKYITT